MRRPCRPPSTLVALAVPLALSLLLVGLDAFGLAGGLRACGEFWVRALDFPALLLRFMLPLLLFAGALHVDADALHARRWQVGLLAGVGTAASTGVVGGLLWLVSSWLGLPLPWLTCLLFGALISPTDPIAVLGMLKSAGAPRELDAVIAGESLFNDGVGVVLFTLLLEMAVGGASPSLAGAGLSLLREAGGGLLLGWLLGCGVARLSRRLARGAAAIPLTLGAVGGGYALAGWLQVSGPLAMVAAGLVVGRAGHSSGEGPAAPGRDRLGPFWAWLDGWLNVVLFALVGMQAVLIRLPAGPVLAGALGAAAVLVTLAARWLTAGWPVRLFPGWFGLPRGAAGLLTWGGLRGGLSLALALETPPGPWRETLVAITYGVVAFSLLVQGSTFPRLVRGAISNGP